MLTSFRYPRLVLRGWVALATLVALGCASPPQGDDATHDVLHEGFGFRADLEGWQIYRDAASAPAMLRPAFINKEGPDDPPLFIAMKDGALLTVLVQRRSGVESQAFFEKLAVGIRKHGEITSAIRLAESGDVLFRSRIGPRAFGAYSHSLVHAADGRVVHLSLTGSGDLPPEESFFDSLQLIELQGEEGWRRPWQLTSTVAGEPLPGYGDVAVEEDPFEAVDCPAGAHPALWSTPAKGGRLYLFGSIHVGHPSFYPFAPAIEAAFEESERLAVELDVSGENGAELNQEVLEAGGLPDGQTLMEVLSEEQFARLGDAAIELGVPVEMFESMSPGMVGLVLSTLPYIVRGFDPKDGVDLYFLDRKGDRAVIELETIQEQLELIQSFDATFLQAALDGMDTVDEDLDALHRSWRCGDPEGLSRVTLELGRQRATTDEERKWVEEFNEVFLFGRNERMADAIVTLLDEEGDTFVVVGAAHLVGDRGVPALLRAAGHTVERIH